MTTHGDIARAHLSKRGLIFFGDVLDEVRELPRPDIRAAVAIAAAHRLVEDEVAKGTADPLALECAHVVRSMWVLLAEGSIVSDPSTSPSRELLARMEGGDDTDRDFVAATLYAGRAIATGEAAAAAWAVDRLIDHRLTRVENPGGPGDADAFAVECAAPAVQATLRRIRRDVRILVDGGLTEATLAELRRADDEG